MKKIATYFIALGLLFSACNPMEEIYNEIDAKAITNVNKDIAVTLSDADYESFGGNVAEDYAFSENDPADAYLPGYLYDLHPALTSGSAANVTYNFSVGYPDLSAYTGAGKYYLSSSDYASVSETVGAVGYFSPSTPAGDYIPSILETALPDAQNGEHYIIGYNYSNTDPNPDDVKKVTVFEYLFTEDLGDFLTFSVAGDQEWYGTANYGAKMSGFSGGPLVNEDWLISPAIDLSGYDDAVLNITQAVNHLNDQWDQLTVVISTDFNGTNPNAATWTALTVPNLPTGNNWSFVESGDIDISAYDGEEIVIGFKYTSSDANAATWEITDFAVKAVGASVIVPTVVEEFYTFDSGWKKSTDAYYVKAEDYNSMGSPGKYDNFSKSNNPDNYLPQLLSVKYPYAQEGDVLAVVYKYYSGGVKTRADEYHFSDGKWIKYNPVVVKTDQFILTESNGWVFDPTISFSMKSSDYQIIVDWVKVNKGSDKVDSYGTQEFYYGAGSYYSNYDLRDGKWDSSAFSTWQDAVKESIGEVLLPAKYPNAVAQVSGIDVMYKVTFATYDGSGGSYTWVFQCTKSGPSPEFTFVPEE